MNQIRIMHVLGSNNLWGAEKIAADICKSISDEQFKLAYASPEGPIEKTLNDMAVEFIPLKAMNPGTLVKAIDGFKPDIIHAHDNKASLFSYLAISTAGKKPIIVSHIHNSYPYLNKIGLHRMADSFFRPRYQANIFCSAMTKDYYKKHAPYFNKIKNSIVMENFTDPAWNKSKAGSGLIKKENDLFRIGFIGRLEYQKGLDAFLKELKLSGNGVWERTMIHIVGDGGMRDTLEEMAAGLRVKFEGYCDNPYEWMKTFDVLILPSRYEGLPLTVLEAMSVGTPVLAMAAGAVAEIIDDGVNGWIVEPGNYKDFVKKLELLAQSGRISEKFSLAAEKCIEEKFSKMQYMSKLKNLYSGLFNGRI
ncbi:MAG: glycosyltransferase family 4 protein [Clostridia bacterium]|nr:glycosyltransferase family 4 protein [Clostridia bacterium]